MSVNHAERIMEWLVTLRQFVVASADAPSQHKEQILTLVLHLLSCSDPPIDEIVDTGAVEMLVNLMEERHDPNIQHKASWALTKIASDNAAQAEYIVRLNVVPLWLNQLSSSSHLQCVEQAALAIGNIAGVDERFRDYLLALGVLSSLVQVLQQQKQHQENSNCGTCSSSNLDVIRNAVFAISNLCRFQPIPSMELAKLNALVPLLIQMCHHDDDDISLNATWALLFICENLEEGVPLLFDHKVDGVLKHLLSTPHLKIPATRLVGALCCSGSSDHSKAVVDSGCLTLFTRFLGPDTSSTAAQKEIAWALSSICRSQDSLHVLQAVCDADGLIPIIVANITNASEFEVRNEMLSACANIAKGGNDLIATLVECGVLEAVRDLLNDNFVDEDILRDALIIMLEAFNMTRDITFTRLQLDDPANRERLSQSLVASASSHPDHQTIQSLSLSIRKHMDS